MGSLLHLQAREPGPSSLCVQGISCAPLCGLWTVALQAPLSEISDKNPGVGPTLLLLGIFSPQGSSLCSVPAVSAPAARDSFSCLAHRPTYLPAAVAELRLFLSGSKPVSLQGWQPPPQL